MWAMASNETGVDENGEKPQIFDQHSVYVGTCQACPFNAVQQEDCSMHEVHGRRNCNHRIACARNSQKTGLDWSQIADDDQCKLTPAYSMSVSTVKPCRGALEHQNANGRLECDLSAVELVASGDRAGPASYVRIFWLRYNKTSGSVLNHLQLP